MLGCDPHLVQLINEKFEILSYYFVFENTSR